MYPLDSICTAPAQCKWPITRLITHLTWHLPFQQMMVHNDQGSALRTKSNSPKQQEIMLSSYMKVVISSKSKPKECAHMRKVSHKHWQVFWQ